MTEQEIASTIVQRGAGVERFMVAVAGPPGSGKSTLAEKLVGLLPRGEAALLQADGFHFDNALLDQLGRRERKGAPDTFDCAGLVSLLHRLKAREDDITIPAFDRTLDVARAGVAQIGRAIRYVVVEGNYLLVREQPWANLRPLFDFTLMIETPRAELERRLTQRWLDHGRDHAEALAWVQSNDMPNADYVMSKSADADLVWQQGA